MSRARAINAKCKDCIYDQCAPGTWRQQTENCSITTCSLWPYRPKSHPKTSDSRQSARKFGHPQDERPIPLPDQVVPA